MYRGRNAATFFLSVFFYLAIFSTAYAQTPPKAGPDSNSTNADKMCPAAQSGVSIYNKDLLHNQIVTAYGQRVFNLYGRPCRDIRNDVEVVEGICTTRDVCSATECFGKECKLPDAKPGGSGSASNPSVEHPDIPGTPTTNAPSDDIWKDGTKPIDHIPTNTGDSSGYNFSKYLNEYSGGTELFNTQTEFSGSILEQTFSGFEYQQPDFGDLSEYGVPTSYNEAGFPSYDTSGGFNAGPESSGFNSAPQDVLSAPNNSTPVAPENGFTEEPLNPPQSPWATPQLPETPALPTIPLAGLDGSSPLPDLAPQPEPAFANPIDTTGTNWAGQNAPLDNPYLNLTPQNIANGVGKNSIDELNALFAAPSGTGKIETPLDIATTKTAPEFGRSETVAPPLPIAFAAPALYNLASNSQVDWATAKDFTDIGHTVNIQQMGVWAFAENPEVIAQQEAARQQEVARQEYVASQIAADVPSPMWTVESVDPDKGAAPANPSTFATDGAGVKVAGNETAARGDVATDAPSPIPFDKIQAAPKEGDIIAKTQEATGEPVAKEPIVDKGKVDKMLDSWGGKGQSDCSGKKGCDSNNPMNVGTFWGKVRKFDTPEEGLAAGINVVRSYCSENGLCTLNKVMEKYAPVDPQHPENNPAYYAKIVGGWTGMSPGQQFDPNNPTQMAQIAVGMARFENSSYPYGSDTIVSAAQIAYNQTSVPVDSTALSTGYQSASNGGSDPFASARPAGSYFDTALQNGTPNDANIPLPNNNPRIAEGALNLTVDVNYRGLVSPLAAIESGTLPDITPIENRIPTASWVPEVLSRTGEQITADIQAGTDREIFGGITEGQSNDRLSEDNQIYADQQAAHDARLAQAEQDAEEHQANIQSQDAQLANRGAQAEREIDAYVQSRIPAPDLTQLDGEAITAQIKEQADQEAGPVAVRGLFADIDPALLSHERLAHIPTPYLMAGPSESAAWAQPLDTDSFGFGMNGYGAVPEPRFIETSYVTADWTHFGTAVRFNSDSLGTLNSESYAGVDYTLDEGATEAPVGSFTLRETGLGAPTIPVTSAPLEPVDMTGLPADVPLPTSRPDVVVDGIPLPAERPDIVVSDVPMPTERPSNLPLNGNSTRTGSEILASAADERLQTVQPAYTQPTAIERVANPDAKPWNAIEENYGNPFDSGGQKLVTLTCSGGGGVCGPDQKLTATGNTATGEWVAVPKDNAEGYKIGDKVNIQVGDKIIRDVTVADYTPSNKDNYVVSGELEKRLEGTGKDAAVISPAQTVQQMTSAQIESRIPVPTWNPEMFTAQSGKDITAQIQAENEKAAVNFAAEYPAGQDAVRPDVGANFAAEYPAGQDVVRPDVGANFAAEYPAGQDSVRPDVEPRLIDMRAADINGTYQLGDATIVADANGLTFTDSNGAESYIAKENLGDKKVADIISESQLSEQQNGETDAGPIRTPSRSERTAASDNGSAAESPEYKAYVVANGAAPQNLRELSEWVDKNPDAVAKAAAADAEAAKTANNALTFRERILQRANAVLDFFSIGSAAAKSRQGSAQGTTEVPGSFAAPPPLVRTSNAQNILNYDIGPTAPAPVPESVITSQAQIAPAPVVAIAAIDQRSPQSNYDSIRGSVSGVPPATNNLAQVTPESNISTVPNQTQINRGAEGATADIKAVVNPAPAKADVNNGPVVNTPQPVAFNPSNTAQIRTSWNPTQAAPTTVQSLPVLQSAGPTAAQPVAAQNTGPSVPTQSSGPSLNQAFSYNGTAPHIQTANFAPTQNYIVPVQSNNWTNAPVVVNRTTSGNGVLVAANPKTDTSSVQSSATAADARTGNTGATQSPTDIIQSVPVRASNLLPVGTNPTPVAPTVSGTIRADTIGASFNTVAENDASLIELKPRVSVYEYPANASGAVVRVTAVMPPNQKVAVIRLSDVFIDADARGIVALQDAYNKKEGIVQVLVSELDLALLELMKTSGIVPNLITIYPVPILPGGIAVQAGRVETIEEMFAREMLTFTSNPNSLNTTDVSYVNWSPGTGQTLAPSLDANRTSAAQGAVQNNAPGAQNTFQENLSASSSVSTVGETLYDWVQNIQNSLKSLFVR